MGNEGKSGILRKKGEFSRGGKGEGRRTRGKKKNGQKMAQK